MTILPLYFPKDIALGAVGGPEFLTDIIETPEGVEQRNIRRSVPRARYQLNYGLKNHQDLEKLRALYYIAKGRAYGFLYHDPLDHTVKGETIGTGDGKKREFQLVKKYQLDEHHAFTRKINCPDETSLHVTLGSNPVTGYKLSQGVVIFDEAPDEGTDILASFDFNVPVRFDTDFLMQKCEGPNAAQIVNIQLIELI